MTALTLTLDARRAHLRQAVKASDDESLAQLRQALADAASIGALPGYRVLQTLAALLPGLDGVNGAARLVGLAARLSAGYGTPLALPATLASKAKGASVMAVALRSLAAVVAGPTDLAREAAAEAHATEQEHEHEQELQG